MNAVASLSTSRSIVRDVQYFIQNFSVQPPFFSSRWPAIPRASLPDPPSLFPFLIAAGAGKRFAKEMDRAYNARALELRSYYEISINEAFAGLTDFSFPDASEKRILDTFTNLYLTKVKSWIDGGVAAYKSNHKRAKQGACNEVSERDTPKPAFNTDCIPLLEHFFDENPFPTHADKAFLAKKSSMTYRQIHVWFQNRRNRSKKANGIWRKTPVSEGATLPPGGPREYMKKHTVHTGQISSNISRSGHSSNQETTQERCSPGTVLHDMSSTTEDNNALDRCTTPSHTFPSPYPPVCVYEPFPLDSRSQTFSPIQWRRLPNPSTPSQSCNIDVDDLVHRFSLLNVRDSFSRRSQRIMQGTQVTTCFITTTPPRAPHPALIRPKRTTSSLTYRSPLPIVRTPQPKPQVFGGPTESSILIPPISCPENAVSSRRKISPLPRRHLHQFPFPYPNWMPASSDVPSSTPLPGSSSRSL